MHLQLRFKHTHILLQENNNTNHRSSSKISTQNLTSQTIIKKITAKVLHITQHYQVHSTNISQHYKVITTKFYTKQWFHHSKITIPSSTH